MNINPLRRSPIKKKAKEHKESAPWRRPKIRLSGAEWREFRDAILSRAAGHCENEINGKRCTTMPINIHHMEHRSLGGSDSKENCLAVCWLCHRMHHDGRLRIEPHREWEP